VPYLSEETCAAAGFASAAGRYCQKQQFRHHFAASYFKGKCHSEGALATEESLKKPPTTLVVLGCLWMTDRIFN
jgi:hypothetical protein